MGYQFNDYRVQTCRMLSTARTTSSAFKYSTLWRAWLMISTHLCTNGTASSAKWYKTALQVTGLLPDSQPAKPRRTWIESEKRYWYEDTQQMGHTYYDFNIDRQPGMNPFPTYTTYTPSICEIPSHRQNTLSIVNLIWKLHKLLQILIPPLRVWFGLNHESNL